jgi:hypothetical protein
MVKRSVGLLGDLPWLGQTGPGTVEEADEEIQTMNGIQFLTDDKGKRTAAVIDLRKHKDLWEDIEDVLVSQSRRHEKRIPFEKVKADLIKSGKLRG